MCHKIKQWLCIFDIYSKCSTKINQDIDCGDGTFHKTYERGLLGKVPQNIKIKKKKQVNSQGTAVLGQPQWALHNYLQVN